MRLHRDMLGPGAAWMLPGTSQLESSCSCQIDLRDSKRMQLEGVCTLCPLQPA